MKDYHVHSGLLDHTKDDIGSIVENANQLGFEEIAITEHFVWTSIINPRIGEDTLFVEQSQIPNDGRKTTDLQSYMSAIEQISRRYKMKILKGLEVDYFSQYENEIREVLDRYRFDILLGSCHYIFDENKPEKERYLHVGLNDQLKSFIEQYGVERVYQLYFENVKNGVASGLFDYMAHLDFLKKALPDYSHEKAFSYMVPILRLMIRERVGLEINLKGINRLQEPFPSHDIIDEYRRLGGRKISIGSDSHSIKQMTRVKPLIENYERRYK